METNTKVDLTGAERCWKCGGAGKLSWTNYANGTCFACQGSGTTKRGEYVERKGVRTFVVDGIVWQFLPLTRNDNGMPLPTRDDQDADYVIVLAFANSQKRRSGMTLLRAAVKPDRARAVWTRAKSGAKSGEKPEAITNADIGWRGHNDNDGGCKPTRNKLGIEEL